MRKITVLNDKYYHKGWEDYENGVIKCPYQKGSWKYSRWMEGWRKAKKFWGNG